VNRWRELKTEPPFQRARKSLQPAPFAETLLKSNGANVARELVLCLLIGNLLVYNSHNIRVSGNVKRCPFQAVFHLLVIFVDGGFVSKLKENLSKFIEGKFGVLIVPEEIKQVRHRSCTDVRIYFTDTRGADYQCFWTITELWKYRSTMTIEDREFHVDDRPWRKQK
jgi:hypothetical protein